MLFDAGGVSYDHAYANTLTQNYAKVIVAGISRNLLNDTRRLLQGRTRAIYSANAAWSYFDGCATLIAQASILALVTATSSSIAWIVRPTSDEREDEAAIGV